MCRPKLRCVLSWTNHCVWKRLTESGFQFRKCEIYLLKKKARWLAGFFRISFFLTPRSLYRSEETGSVANRRKSTSGHKSLAIRVIRPLVRPESLFGKPPHNPVTPKSVLALHVRLDSENSRATPSVRTASKVGCKANTYRLARQRTNNSLQELDVNERKDLYSAENQ